MTAFIKSDTVVLVQGMGKEGSTAALNMRAYGTRVAAGVAPGKGGTDFEGIPLYENVKEALSAHPEIAASFVCVPPVAVKSAASDAITSGIKTVLIITEGVPVHDTAALIAMARENGTALVGPSSIGIIVPGIGKIGSIGGKDNRAYTPGEIAIVSKSGGMCSETALLLTRNGLGQSAVIGIGGDQLIGTSFVDALRVLEHDERTKAIVLYGEIGGTYEEDVAEFIKEGGCTKPVIAFIAGAFASSLQDVALGHAGAMIEGTSGTRESKRAALREAGVDVVDVHHEIVDAIRRVLGG